MFCLVRIIPAGFLSSIIFNQQTATSFASQGLTTAKPGMERKDQSCSTG